MKTLSFLSYAQSYKHYPQKEVENFGICARPAGTSVLCISYNLHFFLQNRNAYPSQKEQKKGDYFPET